MSAERDWVETVKQDIETSLAHKWGCGPNGLSLPYTRQVFSYQSNSNEPEEEQSHGYQTDLLISEQLAGTDEVETKREASPLAVPRLTPVKATNPAFAVSRLAFVMALSRSLGLLKARRFTWIGIDLKETGSS
jgi:hypothetical protein